MAPHPGHGLSVGSSFFFSVVRAVVEGQFTAGMDIFYGSYVERVTFFVYFTVGRERMVYESTKRGANIAVFKSFVYNVSYTKVVATLNRFFSK